MVKEGFSGSAGICRGKRRRDLWEGWFGGRFGGHGDKKGRSILLGVKEVNLAETVSRCLCRESSLECNLPYSRLAAA